MYYICKQNINYLFPPDFPIGAKSLVSRILVRDPRARLPISEIINDKWIKSHTSA